jgi:hypothetical protein
VVGAVTEEITGGQWLKMPADIKKCATPVVNFKQSLFLVPLDDALKPPSAVASVCIDLNDANV